MWRRWTNREPEIGQPVLMETTMDEGYLETIPEVDSLKSKRSSVAAALPELPFRAVPPINEKDYYHQRDSHVSSVYSQPSPDYPPHNFQDLTPITSMPAQGDVSPLSTPRSSMNLASSERSVISPVGSPAQDTSRPSHHDQSFKGHLPRPTTQVPSAIVSDGTHASAQGDQKETRWDTYSGEPTQSEAGKPATVRPGTQAPVEIQYPQLKERTKLILAGLRERERDTKKKNIWGRPPPPVDADPLDNPVQREPWKGASGRTTLVEPVKNTPSARKGPVHFPQRNISRMNANEHQHSVPSAEGPPASKPKSQSPDREEQEARPALSIRVVPSQESIKPVVPLKITSPRVVSPVGIENLATLQSPFQSPHPLLQPDEDLEAVYGGTAEPIAHSPDHYGQTHSPTPPQTPTPVNASPSGIHNSNNLAPGQLPHEQSRFSWTTYATTVEGSPRSVIGADVEENPMPPMPAPITVRKRPVSTTAAGVLPFSNNSQSNQSYGSIISRKPVGAERTRSVSAVSSTTKSLPPTPIEMEAGDKISTLEARLEDLSRRRRNNQRINKELNDSLKRNAISYDARKRKEVEKMLVNLSFELDEITREEHDVGLKLHRAQKKRDQEDSYEKPTGLWIKRVTS